MNADDRALIKQLLDVNQTVATRLSESQNMMAHLAPGLDIASSQIIGAINVNATDLGEQMRGLKLHLSSDLKAIHDQAAEIQTERREWWEKDQERLTESKDRGGLLGILVIRGTIELGIFTALVWMILSN